MHQTFTYKLRLTALQQAACERTLEACRRLYCDAVAERKQTWEREHRSVRFEEQSASLPAMKLRSQDLQEVHSQLLQDVLKRVDVAFRRYFRRSKAGEKPGYPRFRGEGWYDSFTYPQWGNGAQLKDGRLVLSRLGRVRLCADRPLQGKPKTCSIVRKADGWYAHIVCEIEPAALPPTGEGVGIDLGLETFATLSTGEQIANPRLYRRAEKRLKTAHRRLSRRRNGSQRRRKARILLAKAYLKVKRTRLDFCHKTALDLVRRFDTIVVEDLNVQGMARNPVLAKAILDAGWGLFLKVLRDKAARAGRAVVEVDPSGTSQICSRCGQSVPKTLAQRWHSCPQCGLELHRDINSAREIWKRGGGTAFGEAPASAGPKTREPHRSLPGECQKTGALQRPTLSSTPTARAANQPRD
jgi:putative transposase